MSIRCSQGHENPDGSAFCDECGEPLTATSIPAATPGVGGVTCANCGTVNQMGESYCTNCGVSLTSAPAAARPAAVGAAPDMASGVAGAAGHPRLVVDADNAAFDLSGKNEVIIGREDPVSNIYPDVDLTPHGGEEGGVSRLHAKLLLNGGQYLIEDQNSTNFTFVNRQRLEPKTPTAVKDGDEIRLGRVGLKFYTS